MTAATVTDLDRLLEQVILDQPDSDIRLVAADAAEDAGRPHLAECLRWMHERRSVPYPKRIKGRHRWYYEEVRDDGAADVPHALPVKWNDVKEKVLIGVPFYSIWKVEYDTAEDAFRALWQCWEEEREKGTEW